MTWADGIAAKRGSRFPPRLEISSAAIKAMNSYFKRIVGVKEKAGSII
jgi:hypothetical protein